MKALQSYWLKGRPFVAGQEISIADLLMVTELDTLQLLVGASEVEYLDLTLSLNLTSETAVQYKPSIHVHPLSSVGEDLGHRCKLVGQSRHSSRGPPRAVHGYWASVYNEVHQCDKVPQFHLALKPLALSLL